MTADLELFLAYAVPLDVAAIQARGGPPGDPPGEGPGHYFYRKGGYSLTRDDRTALFGVVHTFVPNHTFGMSPSELNDERVLLLVGEAMAQQDALINDLRAQLQDRRQEQLYATAESGAVPPEQITSLLRHHRISYNDVHMEGYTDDHGVQRLRPRVVPRPALVEDVLGHRDTEDAGAVVLKDGTRHRLAYADQEVS